MLFIIKKIAMLFESALCIGNIIAWLPLEVLEWAAKLLF